MNHLIGYLRECYREDNARAGIWNVFAKAVQHQIFADGEEQLATDRLDDIHLPPGRAQAALKKAESCRREKALLYGTLFVVGKTALRDGERPISICAPLILFPATIESSKTEAKLQIDQSARRLNSALLHQLDSEDVGLVDLVSEELSDGGITEGDVLRIGLLLKEHVRGMDDSAVAEFPTLKSKSELEKMAAKVKKVGKHWQLVSAAGVALFPQSSNTRGLLTELGELANGDFVEISDPLRLLLTGEAPEPTWKWPKEKTPLGAPALLSTAQEKILRSARENPLTIVIGPPGTGKSFTIAALAVDHVARGESVLVSSRMDHAVDVVAKKIEEMSQAKNLLVRAGRSSYLKELKSYVDGLLAGMFTTASIGPEKLKMRSRQLRLLSKRMQQAEEHLARQAEVDGTRGMRLAKWGDGFWGQIYRDWLVRRQHSGNSLSALVKELQELFEQWVEMVRKSLHESRVHQLQLALEHNRPQLNALNRALRSRTSAKQEEYFRLVEFEDLFRALPIWLVNMADVHRVLPHRAEMFDVAIIDEASQCDIASALPILQRAKRVVIAGDPRQLEHVTFLSKKRMGRLAEQFELSEEEQAMLEYRGESLLDLARQRVVDQERVGFLNEHFRSDRDIIGFSNQQFYNGALQIMTDHQRPESGIREPAARLHVTEGKRNPSGVNRVEADAMIDLLKKALGAKNEPIATIGVLSPFRNQVDYLRKRIEKDLNTKEWAAAHGAHELLIGTAHTFQGEERDIMLISLTVDADTNAATLRFLERPDVFNVSITRARREQHVFLSRPAETFAPKSLLGEYCTFLMELNRGGETKTADSAAGNEAKFDLSWLDGGDPFAVQLIEGLEKRKLEAEEGYEIAGTKIDVLVRRGIQKLGIDLIGYPGAHQEMVPMKRYRMLFRAGIQLLPLSYVSWVSDREKCLEEIERRFR